MISDLPRPFLFIHIPKNAGTSVETALVSALLGIPSLAEVDPETADRHALPGGRRHVAGFPFRIRSSVVQHECVEYFERLGLLDGRTVFSVVRNPYDRALSELRYLLRTDPEAPAMFRGPTWADDLKTLARLDDARVHDLKACQVDWLLDSAGKLRCDHVLRFENLGEGWERLCGVLGLDEAALPHINRTRRGVPWWEYYDEEAAELIHARYARDFEAFGYAEELPQKPKRDEILQRLLWIGRGDAPEGAIRHPLRGPNGRMEFPDGCFGEVRLYGALEMLPPDEARGLLRECRRVLHPEGRLVVNTLDLEFVTGLLPAGYDPGSPQYEFVRAYSDSHLLESETYNPAEVINHLMRRHGQCFLYDEALLAELLDEAGFDGKREPGESPAEIHMIATCAIPIPKPSHAS
jgi:hypothetical protein